MVMKYHILCYNMLYKVFVTVLLVSVRSKKAEDAGKKEDNFT